MKLSIGIDPGMSGAIAVINADTREVLDVLDCPTMQLEKTKRDYNTPKMAEILRKYAIKNTAFVTIERAQAMPGQGVTSTFHTGRGYGVWLGILGALEIPFQTIRPTEWTKKLLKGIPGKGKERSIRFAMSRFPGAELIPERCKKPRDGRADALCLSWYGSLLNISEWRI